MKTTNYNHALPKKRKPEGSARASFFARGILCRAGAALLALLTLMVTLFAAPVQADTVAATNQIAAAESCPVVDYFTHWFDRVNEIQSGQPHWITPLVTVTPRVEE